MSGLKCSMIVKRPERDMSTRREVLKSISLAAFATNAASAEAKVADDYEYHSRKLVECLKNRFGGEWEMNAEFQHGMLLVIQR